MVLSRPMLKLLLTTATVVLSAPVAIARVDCAEIPVANDRCPQWVATHDVPDARGNSGRDEALVVAAADGRVFVAGGTETGAPALEVLAMAQGTGAELWTARIAGPSSSLGSHLELTVTPDGSRLLLMTNAGGDFLVVALDPASGTIQWSATYDGPVHGYDFARGMAVAPSSDQIYVTGTSPGGRAGDLVLVALSAADGGLLWTVRYRSPYSSSWSWDSGHAVVPSRDGSRVFVVGRSSGHSSSDFVTLAYNVPGEDEQPSATWAWKARYTPATNVGVGSRLGLALSEDGSRVVASGEGMNNFPTLAYKSATGQRLWTAQLKGTPISNGWASTVDESLVEISGGKVFVAISKALDPGYLLASYDLSTGAELWSTRFLAGPPLATADMVLGPDSVYVLANSLDAGYGATLAAFDPATGTQQWVGRMLSPGDGIYANALAMSGDSLFATGGIFPLDFEDRFREGTLDFLTWSYRI